MIRINLLPAEYGDSILISIGNNNIFNILIDGGTSKTYDNFLKKEITLIKNLNQKLNLVICTHMDYDHISGLIKIVSNCESQFIESMWYNGFLQVINKRYFSNNHLLKEDNQILDKIISRYAPYDNTSKNISINDGMSLGVLLENKNIPINKITNGSAISTEFINKPINITTNTQIILLSPNKNSLLDLENYWKNEMVSKNYRFTISNKLKLTEAFEYQLETIKSHYSFEKINISSSENLEKYLNCLNISDNSVTNKSSISFILKHLDYTFLFLGDVLIDDTILNNIEKYVGHSYNFTAIKVPHHGSRYNINNQFIKRYTANEYYFLTNSKKFNHPDLSVIASIICSNKRKKTFFFNYPLEKILFLSNSTLKEKYNYEIIIGTGTSPIERNFYE